MTFGRGAVLGDEKAEIVIVSGDGMVVIAAPGSGKWKEIMK